MPRRALGTLITHGSAFGEQAITIKDDGGTERIVVIDSRVKEIAVYGVSADGGKLQLLSSRKVTDDMSLDVFNGKGLLPKDIRAMKDVQPN